MLQSRFNLSKNGLRTVGDHKFSNTRYKGKTGNRERLAGGADVEEKESPENENTEVQNEEQVADVEDSKPEEAGAVEDNGVKPVENDQEEAPQVQDPGREQEEKEEEEVKEPPQAEEGPATETKTISKTDIVSPKESKARSAVEVVSPEDAKTKSAIEAVSPKESKVASTTEMVPSKEEESCICVLNPTRTTGDQKVDEMIDYVHKNLQEAGKVLASLGENFEHDLKLMFVEVMGKIQKWTVSIQGKLDAAKLQIDQLRMELVAHSCELVFKDKEIDSLKTRIEELESLNKTQEASLAQLSAAGKNGKQKSQTSASALAPSAELPADKSQKSVISQEEEKKKKKSLSKNMENLPTTEEVVETIDEDEEQPEIIEGETSREHVVKKRDKHDKEQDQDKRVAELEWENARLRKENKKLIKDRMEYENAIQRALLRGVSSLNVEALKVLRCPPFPCCTPCVPCLKMPQEDTATSSASKSHKNDTCSSPNNGRYSSRTTRSNNYYNKDNNNNKNVHNNGIKVCDSIDCCQNSIKNNNDSVHRNDRSIDTNGRVSDNDEFSCKCAEMDDVAPMFKGFCGDGENSVYSKSQEQKDFKRQNDECRSNSTVINSNHTKNYSEMDEETLCTIIEERLLRNGNGMKHRNEEESVCCKLTGRSCDNEHCSSALQSTNGTAKKNSSCGDMILLLQRSENKKRVCSPCVSSFTEKAQKVPLSSCVRESKNNSNEFKSRTKCRRK